MTSSPNAFVNFCITKSELHQSQKVLDNLGLKRKMYMRDCNINTNIAIVNLHPSKGTHGIQKRKLVWFLWMSTTQLIEN